MTGCYCFGCAFKFLVFVISSYLSRPACYFCAELDEECLLLEFSKEALDSGTPGPGQIEDRTQVLGVNRTVTANKTPRCRLRASLTSWPMVGLFSQLSLDMRQMSIYAVVQHLSRYLLTDFSLFPPHHLRDTIALYS